jgi:hypothetical protein
MTPSRRAQAWAVSLLAAALTAYVAGFALMDTDIWWHLAAGRLMVEERRLLFHDPFAADTLGCPWVDVHWLFQIFAYLLYRAGGIAGLVMAKIALVGVGVGLAVRALCARLARPLWLPAAVTVVAMLCPARHLILARPTVLSLLAITLMLLILRRVQNEGRLRWAFLLIPLQVVWANVQGLYLLGPGILACFTLGAGFASLLYARVPTAKPPRRLLMGLAALVPLLVLCSVITPYGWHGLRLPFVLFGRIDAVTGQVFSREVSENIAPWLLERTGQLSSFKWLAAFTFVSFLPLLLRGVADLPKLCVATLFFVLALLANRNVLLFLWVAGPIVAENLATLLTRTPHSDPTLIRGGHWLRRVLIVGAAVGTIAILFDRTREARGEPSIATLAPFRVPEQAVDRFLESGSPAGPIFCSDRYGGYLTWRLFPAGRPMMDGRLVLRSAQSYLEHLALGDHPENFEAYRRRHGIRTVILPTAYPDRFLPLVVWLYRQPDWRLLYTDGTQTLFVLDEDGRLSGHSLDLQAPETLAVIRRELETRYGSHSLVHDRARLHLARLLAEIGATGPAEELLALLPGTTARALRARVAYLAGESGRAEQMAKAMLASQPDELESLCLLAVLARDRGDHRMALGHLRRALEVDPFHPLALQLVDQIQRDLH